MNSLDFTCNCCGTSIVACPVEMIDREVPSCPTCQSTVRWRSIVHLLSVGLHGNSIPLPRWPVNKAIRGIGLSYWSGYADGLADKTNYTNTYFHTEPSFDVVAPRPDYINQFDYLVSSEVFEHVVHPVSRAFDGARTILRSGGVFVFTVPFFDAPETVEHFPHLNAFKIIEIDGEHILVNKRQDGTIETHRDLVFHGGPGTTLEMRMFCRTDVINHLRQAGFVDITVMDQDVPEYGIIHKHSWGLPIFARVP